ncbi:hypothetical protein [Saccharothrix sp. Mg75]|uniref:hypothetical protein n=1 Tax=Saccharothrix sp. Mg75 TaxID=3445357 RepID=UPI003EE922B2
MTAFGAVVAPATVAVFPQAGAAFPQAGAAFPQAGAPPAGVCRNAEPARPVVAPVPWAQRVLAPRSVWPHSTGEGCWSPWSTRASTPTTRS